MNQAQIEEVMGLVDAWERKEYEAAIARIDPWSEHAPNTEPQLLERLYSEASAARLAISTKLRQLMSWQPIETAPKDFTEFDGWNGQRITDVYWGPREGNPKGEKTWVRDVYETNHGWVVEEVFSLTHWMKKPEAPQ